MDAGHFAPSLLSAIAIEFANMDRFIALWSSHRLLPSLHRRPPLLQNLWMWIALQCCGHRIIIRHTIVIRHGSIRPSSFIPVNISYSSTICTYSSRSYIGFFYLICTSTYFRINTYIYVIFILIHTLT